MSAHDADDVLAAGPGGSTVPRQAPPTIPTLQALPVRPGHVRSVELLEQSVALRQTHQLYEQALGHGVYFRPTAAGLTVLSLDPGTSGMVGVGSLTQLLPHRSLLEQHMTAYRIKRDGMIRSSVEERLSVAWTSHALRHGLALPGHDELAFICQEWAFPLAPRGSVKLDVLAVDRATRRLVVLELKSRAGSPGVGGTPDQQAERYARYLHDGRKYFTPFFGRLCRAMATAYDAPVQMQALDLDDSRPPGSLVVYADDAA